VLAGLAGMSASWLKGIERGTRLPLLVKLAEGLAVSDVAVLAGTDMDLGGAVSVPVSSFAHIPHDAVPAIREAIRDPLLTVPAGPADVAALAARTADAWLLWHQSAQHRTDVGRILPRLVTDARIAARATEGQERRAANAVLADVYALVQHEVVWASEAKLTWTAADRAMTAAQEADTPAALAGAAWTLGMVQRSAGDTDGALTLARDAAGLLEPRLEEAGEELRALYGALQLHAATTAARAGREGDAWRHWDQARTTGTVRARLPRTCTSTPPDRQLTSVPRTSRRSPRISPAPAPRQMSPAARIRRSAVGWASASARNPLISAGLQGFSGRSRGSGRSAGYSCGTTRRPMNRRFVRSVRRAAGDRPGAHRVNRSVTDGCSSTSGTASRPSGIA
jgi:hypothetical protein